MIYLGADIETTGLDPRRDAILEIFVQPVNEDLEECGEPFHRFVQFDRRLWGRRIDQRVIDMHEKSGVWEKCLTGDPLDVVLSDLEEYLREFPKAIFIGRNFGTFDRLFLESARPGVTREQSHRNFDLSTLLSFWKSMLGESLPTSEEVAHTADGDVRRDLETLRYLRSTMSEAMTAWANTSVPFEATSPLSSTTPDGSEDQEPPAP